MDLKTYARKNKAVLTDDPDGLLSTLQVAKRLVNESIKDGEPVTVVAAVHKALQMSAPKDEARAWWKTVRVLLKHTEQGKSSLAILTDAIAAQGRMNHQIKKRIPA